MLVEVIKILFPTAIAFGVGILITPLVTYYLYKFRVWKKKPGKQALDGQVATEFNRLHKEKETQTPRMGGIVIWGSVLITTVVLFLLSLVFADGFFQEIAFFSRSQTWIPLATLIIGSAVGLINDIYDTRKSGNGLRLRVRLLFVAVVSAVIAWWFYSKLDVVSIGIPYDGDLYLGILIIPFFILLSLGLYASGVIDGIDGLSGGVFATIFTTYAIIAFGQEQLDLAAFCATVAGAILAFLWFNIPPARFWMTETGTMGLTLTLAVVVFMSDNLGGGYGIAVLPIIGLPLIATVASNIIQVFSKRVFGKKVFRVAPLHHHFEALGWPGYKVTMRYWIISIVCAIIGLSIATTA